MSGLAATAGLLLWRFARVLRREAPVVPQLKTGVSSGTLS
jgi:hypothetical protein